MNVEKKERKELFCILFYFKLVFKTVNGTIAISV
jgi:hypothetical protein